jgi:drug/metabolite transporter (DMT)-like permease
MTRLEIRTDFEIGRHLRDFPLRVRLKALAKGNGSSPVMASLNILLAILLWSTQGVVVRLSGIPAHILIFYSCIVSIVLQASIIHLRGAWREFPPLREFRYPALLGFFLLVNTFSYFYAFNHTSIAGAVLTHYTAPVIVACLSPFFLREVLTGRIAFAIAIASAGLWIMLSGFSFHGLAGGRGEMAGMAAGVVSGFAYAAVILFARKYTGGIDPLVLTFLTNIAVLLLLAPFVRQIPWSALPSFLIVGVLHSTLAPYLYYRGLRYVAANRAAVLGYLEPVAAIVFGMIFLKEMPGPMPVAGGTLIILAGYLTVRK